jgi:hypothetical protein
MTHPMHLTRPLPGLSFLIVMHSSRPLPRMHALHCLLRIKYLYNTIRHFVISHLTILSVELFLNSLLSILLTFQINNNIYTMSAYTIHVAGLAPETTEEKLHDFFSFCGKLVSVKKEGSSADITFEKLSAMRTSL